MRVSYMFSLAALLVLAAACGGQPEPEVAAEPAVDTAAMNRARQDSIDAANRARAEEEARRRAEEEARAREEAARRLAEELRNDLATAVFFDYDQSSLRPEAESKLDRKAAILQANPDLRLQVSGHADERGSDEYNLALGNRRAMSAKRYLVNQGVEEGRVEIVSYGEERPVCEAATEECWQQNRRDDFTITGGGENLVAPQ